MRFRKLALELMDHVIGTAAGDSEDLIQALVRIQP